MRNIIFDTDPGIDDAIAIILALNNLDKINVELITTVFGNVNINKTTKNALNLVNFMNKNIPVARGASKAMLVSSKADASEIHGESGMDGYTFPEHNLKELPNAIEEMKKVIKKNDKTTIVAVGALTNVATLILAYPELQHKIDEIVIMGGSLSGGNTNTVAEFNIYSDPHACKIIFNTNIKITVFGLDVTRKSIIKSNNLEKLKNANKVSNMCYSILKNYRSEGFKKGLMMHDATTIAYLLKPELFEFDYKYIDVILDGEAQGAFVSDYYTIKNSNKNKNIKYAINVDEIQFEEFIIKQLIK